MSTLSESWEFVSDPNVQKIIKSLLPEIGETPKVVDTSLKTAKLLKKKIDPKYLKKLRSMTYGQLQKMKPNEFDLRRIKINGKDLPIGNF